MVNHPLYGRKLLAEIDKFQAIKRKLSQKKDFAMITEFNKMPWTIRDSKSIRMMRLHKDALKMRKIARRFADEEIESKMDKLKSLVSKAIEWLRNKGRIIVQANPIATNLFKGLLSLNSALQMWSGVYHIGSSIGKASTFAKEARRCNLSVSQFLSQLPPEARPLSILLKGIKLLLTSIIKSLAVREISKMQSEKIQDAGVKGMKKGEHRMAHDPDYVASLKGGNGNSNAGGSSQPVSVKKAAAIGAGLGAGYSALGTGINAAVGNFKGLKKGPAVAGVALATGLASAAGAGAGALGAKIYNKLSRKNKDSYITMSHMPWAFKEDAGVKGMKKGQHIKAKDPDYVESLKGGGSASGGASSVSQPEKKGLSTRQKVGIGMMIGGGALMAGGLLGMRHALKGAAKAKSALPSTNVLKGLGGTPASNAALHGIGNASSQASKAAAHAKTAAENTRNIVKGKINTTGGIREGLGAKAMATEKIHSARKQIHSGGYDYSKMSDLKKALNDPNHVFDI